MGKPLIIKEPEALKNLGKFPPRRTLLIKMDGKRILSPKIIKKEDFTHQDYGRSPDS